LPKIIKIDQRFMKLFKKK